MPGPLNGLKILDFSTLLPGPMATLILAEAGADVIKIERPGIGEEMRSYFPKWGRDSVNFALLNRGKKSLAVDLKDPHEQARLRPLIEQADVLVEQFRPGTMTRLGLDYDSVAAINPGIVYCSITGYGQTGPKRDRAGHDANYIGDTGLLALSMGTAEAPVLPPALIADIAGGALPAVINILLALRDRQLTGKGSRLDIAMAENVFTFMYWAIGNGLAAGEWPGNGRDLVTGGTPRYRLYPTSDNRVVAVAALEDKFWNAFTAAIGLKPEWRDDARDPEGTAKRIAEIIRSRDSAHWESVLVPADCCCSIVRTVREALNDSHFIERGVFGERVVNENDDAITAIPVPVARQFRAHLGEVLGAPRLGADNEDLLS